MPMTNDLTANPPHLQRFDAPRAAPAVIHPDKDSTPRRLAAKLSEIILGGQDGLVNVAGVILGLAAATPDTRIIIAGGLAATFAESISMAAVAYTSALADRDYYRAEKARMEQHISEEPEHNRDQVRGIFAQWGLEGELLDQAVDRVTQNPAHWNDVLMAHEQQLQPVHEASLVSDSILVGVSAIVGSLIPLLPFFFLERVTAVLVGLVLCGLVLFGVGAFKARLTVGHPTRSGLQMMGIGLVSALAGYAIGAIFGG